MDKLQCKLIKREYKSVYRPAKAKSKNKGKNKNLPALQKAKKRAQREREIQPIKESSIP